MAKLRNCNKNMKPLTNVGRRRQNSELLFTPQIKGKKIESSEDKEEHDEQALRLNRKIGKNLVVARLALHALPAHRKRNDKNTDEIFAIETASQLLARILLLRFFEDHNFFGNEKYVCNGGVKELQGFIRRSGKGYAFVAREAYERGGEVCDEAFEENHLDWVLSSKNEHVSRAIEMTMMLLSRFNFSTVSGDILTGIYDRFLDKEQRKEQGEFYTPPSVARYIVQRLNIRAEDSVFDPACGSGTFLLEAFEQMTRGDIRDGRGNYDQAEAALSRIGGNDLNPFSAMMARIQILWHLLPLKQDLKTRGFPNIRISGGIDAIAQQGEMHGEGDAYEYADLNRGAHNAVVGNPPYVRPERSGEVDKETQAFYAEIGGASKNFYDLFVYKALARWCVKDKKRPGRLGFVLPLSFCDSDNSAPLRRLFEVGGRFCVLEIVDMEMISPLVFDAAVNPIVLLAENRPAKAEDKIILRIAGEECVLGDGEFDLSRATESKFDYEQVFANGNGKTKTKSNGNGNGKAEGGRRILTKLSKKRKRITDIMGREKQTLADVAREYYVGIDKGRKIKEWRDTPPDGALMEGGASNGVLRWGKRRMLGRGAVSRGKMQIATKDGGGLDFYKGENVSSCLVEGEPAQANMLPDSLDDPSLWRFPHLLPGVGYAFLRITLGITGAKFNPHELAFMDTATLLIPNEEWEKFPLDIALTSRIYQFYYACYLRESPVQKLWSHLYPRTLEKIPLPSALLAQSKKLGELRERFLDLCEKTNQRAVALAGFLQEAPAGRLKDICRDNQLAIAWSDGLSKGREVKICAPTVDSIKAEGGRVLLDGVEWLEVKDPEVARGVAAALAVLHERELKKEHLQEMQIPINKNARAAFQEAARKYDKGGHADKLEEVMAEIDSIVGAAFGLSAADICQIQKEMKEDSFLSKIRPNLPFVERRRRGLSSKLASPTRYQRTTD